MKLLSDKCNIHRARSDIFDAINIQWTGIHESAITRRARTRLCPTKESFALKCYIMMKFLNNLPLFLFDHDLAWDWPPGTEHCDYSKKEKRKMSRGCSIFGFKRICRPNTLDGKGRRWFKRDGSLERNLRRSHTSSGQAFDVPFGGFA